MNVPNFNFDAEGRSDRLPSTAANGSRSIAHAPYGEFVNFNAQDESTPDYRKLFFSVSRTCAEVPLAHPCILRHRFSNRVYLNFHVDPDLSGNGDHSDRPHKRQR